MGFLDKLLGRGKASEPQSPAHEPVEYKGFSIRPTPIEESGQYRLCAEITLGEKQHHFIRSDVVPTEETCLELTLLKAKRLIDEQGEQIF